MPGAPDVFVLERKSPGPAALSADFEAAVADEAESFCKGRGQRHEKVDVQSAPTWGRMGNLIQVTYRFRCVAPVPAAPPAQAAR